MPKSGTDADPGIHHAVQQIGQQVDEDEESSGNQYRTHHHREVEFLQGIDGYLADAAPSENVFHEKKPLQGVRQTSQ